jgi:hypothetical protein
MDAHDAGRWVNDKRVVEMQMRSSMKQCGLLVVFGMMAMWTGGVSAVDLPPGVDPTETLTRADVAVRYARSDKKYFGAFFGGELLLVPNIVLGLRVPYLNIDDPGKSDSSGFGDISLQGGWRVMANEEAAMRLNLEVVFDTSDDDILGADTDIVFPSVVGSFFLHDQDAVMGAVLGHYFDVGGGEGSINETELRPYFLQNLGWGSWYEVIAHLYMDWDDGNEFGWFQELRACQMVNDQIGVTADVGFRLAGDNRLVQDWSVGMSARYFF